MLQRTTSSHRKFISFLHFRKRSAILSTLYGGLLVMGIESLNSAVAAAGFAMVSDEDVDGSAFAGQSAFPHEQESTAPASVKTQALALIDTTARAPAFAVQSLGEKVTGLLEAWRPKG
jgi:hypothetical protein